MKKLLLDAGHSGTTFGHYWTPGKRSPHIPPGFFEGDMNREICESAAWSLNEACFLNPGPYPIALKDRVAFANRINKKEKSVLLSVHCNAAGNGKTWNKANGFTVFVHPRASQTSKDFADHLSYFMQEETILKNRGIKTARFKILSVDCPAVLLECGFMTNKKDVDYLSKIDGKLDCGTAIEYAWKELTK